MVVGDRAARRIAAEAVERRTAVADPYLGQLGEGPWAVAVHLARYQRVDSGTLRADVGDGLRLVGFLRAELDRVELRMFEAAERVGLTLGEVAELAGLAGRQAVYAHRRGLRARVGRHDEAAAVSDAREREVAGGPDPDEVRAVARELARQVLVAVPELEDAARSVQDDLGRWRGGPPPVELVDDLRALLDDLGERRPAGQDGRELAGLAGRGADLLG